LPFVDIGFEKRGIKKKRKLIAGVSSVFQRICLKTFWTVFRTLDGRVWRRVLRINQLSETKIYSKGCSDKSNNDRFSCHGFYCHTREAPFIFL